MRGGWGSVEDQLVVEIVREPRFDVRQRPAVLLSDLGQDGFELLEFVLVGDLFEVVEPWFSVDVEGVPIHGSLISRCSRTTLIRCQRGWHLPFLGPVRTSVQPFSRRVFVRHPGIKQLLRIRLPLIFDVL